MPGKATKHNRDALPSRYVQAAYEETVHLGARPELAGCMNYLQGGFAMLTQSRLTQTNVFVDCIFMIVENKSVFMSAQSETA